MRIGVDAGALGVTDERLKVGVYRVISNMLRVLGQTDTKNQYILYSFEPVDTGLMQEFGPNMENKVLWPVRGWFRFRLPLELRLHPVDIFLGASQALPVTHTKTIGFVYDVGFLHHPSSYPGSYKKLLYRTKKLVQDAGSIITISESVKNDISKSYGRTSGVTVVYPGISEQFHQDNDSHNGAIPYFLFVGALKRGKNIPTLIRAFNKFLKDQKQKYDLYLVGGDYWLDKEIDKEIKKFKLKHRINKLGVVTDNELAQYYKGAVALVSPSLHEGFCLPVVEAFATACPVIGSTTPAMQEIIADAGITVDPHSPDEIGNAMAKIANNKKFRTSLIQKGIIRSRAYSWDTFGKSVLRVIHETAAVL